MRRRVHGPFGLGTVKEQAVRCQRTLVVMHTGAGAMGPACCRELRRRRSAP